MLLTLQETYKKRHKMRIKFIANSIFQAHLGSKPDYRIIVNPAYFMMKHYHTLHGKHQPKWLLQDFIANKTAQELVDSLISERVELLLLPCFVWNMDLQMEVAKLYKEQTRDISKDFHVVVGGPHLTAHKDPKFFEKYPFIDYAVYGDGEKALSNIIDYIATGERSTWVNTVENVNGKARVWPFEVLRDEKYWRTSPYLTQKQFIRDNLEAMYTETGLSNLHVMFALEFARGCMYKCAYCDWSQNLTKKVTRRIADWKLELEFFRDLDVQIRETDANFGQWKQDVEIYEYAIKLFNPKRNFKFLVWNTAKLDKNKDRFFVPQVLTYNSRITFSFEDTEKGPLEAMHRPSLSWPEQQAILGRVKDRIGEGRFNKYVTAELMLGSPKQSITTFKENFKKLLGEGISNVILNQWVLAPNSPGADLNYQKKHGVKWKDHLIYNNKNQSYVPKSIEDAYNWADNNPNFVKQKCVYSTNDIKYVDIIATTIAGNLMNSNVIQHKVQKISAEAIQNHDMPDMAKVINWLFDFSQKKAREILKLHKDCIKKYGFVLPYYISNNTFVSVWATTKHYN